MSDPIQEFLANGGQVTKIPRSKRALTDRHFRYLTRGELLNAASYHNVRQDRLQDAAARRAQRGIPKEK